MNINKINVIAYKALCIASCAVLFIIGFKIIFDGLFVKGLFSLVCSVVFSLLLFQKPSVRTWVQVVVVVVVAIMIIGELERISNLKKCYVGGS